MLSDKQEIFDAIAVRELDTFRVEIERAFTARQLIFSPRKVLERVLDAYVDFLESRPHFRILALGKHISERTRENQSDPQTGPGEFSAICWWKSTDGSRERKCGCASGSRRRRATG